MTPDDVRNALANLPSWNLANPEGDKPHRLRRTWAFPDFAQALALVNEVGAFAEAQNHHPDIYLTWGRVTLELWTHDQGTITQQDLDWCQALERFLT